MDTSLVVPIITKKCTVCGITAEDAAKELAAEEAGQSILNYCNIEEIPEALLYTWASMAVDVLIFYAQVKASAAGTTSTSGSDDDSVLSGVGLGGLSISFSQKSKTTSNFAAGSAMGGTSTLDKDKIALNYKSHLDRFRKLSW